MDAWLAGVLGPAWRVILYGLLASTLSMLTYRILSPQQRLKSLKIATSEVRTALARSGDDMQAVLRLSGRNLKIATAILALTFGPAMLSSIPTLIMAVWVYALFHYAHPALGVPVSAATEPSGHRVEFSVEDGVWVRRLPWQRPEDGVNIRVDGSTIFSGSLGSVGYLGLHVPFWLDDLDGLPTALLSPRAPVDAVVFRLPRLSLWPDLGGWAGHWEWTFFGAIALWSILLKSLLHIE